jgi:hypothetical protein
VGLLSAAALVVGLVGLPGATAFAGSGPQWTAQKTPSPSPSDSYLAAVACPTSTACVAVGGYLSKSNITHPLVEAWTGTTWVKQASPSDPGGSLAAISCLSATSCIAVGYTLSGSGVDQPLIEAWNGISWQLQSSPTEPGGSLAGVTCLSAQACQAVGSVGSSQPGGRVSTLAETWDGTAWKIQATPNMSAANDYFSAVACSAKDACLAVGGYFNSTPTGGFFAASWNGRTWAITSVPAPKGTDLAYLNGVACPSPGGCLAVGTAEVGSTLVYVAEAWNGTAWKIQTSANPHHEPGTFAAISCSSPDACTAVGSTGFQLHAEGWNGAMWSDANPPARTDQPSFDGVACTATSTCTAVGTTYDSTTSVGKTLAEAERPGS